MNHDVIMTEMREAVRTALNNYEAGLKNKLDSIPRGSGNAMNEWDYTVSSITQVKDAKRVLWLED